MGANQFNNQFFLFPVDGQHFGIAQLDKVIFAVRDSGNAVYIDNVPVADADEAGIHKLFLNALNGLVNFEVFPVNKMDKTFSGNRFETEDAVVPEKKYLVS